MPPGFLVQHGRNSVRFHKLRGKNSEVIGRTGKYSPIVFKVFFSVSVTDKNRCMQGVLKGSSGHQQSDMKMLSTDMKKKLKPIRALYFRIFMKCGKIIS